MAITLKMKFYLVILAFGFFAHLQVNGLECYICMKEGTVDQDCTDADVKTCDAKMTACEKYHTTKPSKTVGRQCGISNPLYQDKCVSADKLGGKDYEGMICQCSKDRCNSVGHLHGWTFVLLIAISFVVVLGAGAKP